MMTFETCSSRDRGWMGDPRRGASLGRSSRHGDPDTAARFYLHRVYLDSGGYDAGGSYWGHGEPLYEAYTADGEIFIALRAWSRDKAKAEVREDYPDARFFR